jgi:fluoride ion exporter CrcB/FEX
MYEIILEYKIQIACILSGIFASFLRAVIGYNKNKKIYEKFQFNKYLFFNSIFVGSLISIAFLILVGLDDPRAIFFAAWGGLDGLENTIKLLKNSKK